MRRDQCCGLAFRNNYSANRLASRSAALSQNCMCRQRRIARSGSLYEEWRPLSGGCPSQVPPRCFRRATRYRGGRCAQSMWENRSAAGRDRSCLISSGKAYGAMDVLPCEARVSHRWVSDWKFPGSVKALSEGPASARVSCDQRRQAGRCPDLVEPAEHQLSSPSSRLSSAVCCPIVGA